MVSGKYQQLWFQVQFQVLCEYKPGLPSEMGRFTQRERCNLALGPLGHMDKATAPSPRK